MKNVNEQPALLRTESLCFSYYERPILRDISLSLRRGEFLGLLGPKGSGKSTFLKNVLGYLKPSQGRVVFAETTRRETVLAFVPQSTGLHAAMTVRDAVLMGRLPYLKDRWAGYCREDHELVTQTLTSL
ncbi:MAG: ABC transporter ATP-binding protein, partial [Treponema sp.]|nr:ABC transporter ATP-binding protein [Treponema sp.]